ncbi:hypothetical protein ACIOHC_11285 [Streptomyces sp. NPDC088252]|uniref:hypothetical protein n=1 Tax=unclassified Streptomyces TaxID=2593676 RepID=UPI0037FA31D8
MTHPTRGREVSAALTEARTVLSRAESALSHLDGPTEWLYELDGCTPLDDANGDWIRAYDPDHDELVRSLTAVIALLEPWQRTGRPEGTEKQRQAAMRGIPCACGRLWAGRIPAGHIKEMNR